MNDEANSAETKSGTPLPTETAPSFAPTAEAHQPIVYWLKRLFACNPFYLVSAALLLFGMYRVSIDSSFLEAEVARLRFNFASLQLYELLLVGIAIVLAGRAIWYDAKLLLALENLLWLVPFILISQAALINQRTVWALSLATAVLAVFRFGAVERWMFEIKYPPRLLLCGLAVLILNTALPVCYRTFNETKYGAWPTWGTAYYMSQLCWLGLLPLVCALIDLLPPARDTGEVSARRRWFPLGTYSLWLLGTGVHLYCLSYVYEFKLSRGMFVPVMWVVAWTFCRRLAEFVAEPTPGVKAGALLLPLIVAFVAVGDGSGTVFFVINLLNAIAFAGIIFTDRRNHVALHLLLISLAAVVAGLPHDWTQSAVMEFSRGKFVALAALAYLILSTALSRNPKLAIPGAIATAIATGLLRGEQPDTNHWVIQGGLVFLLLHSLRWRDSECEGARLLRWLAGVAWVIHGFIWAHCGAEFLQPFSIGAAVLAIYWTRWAVIRELPPVILPVAAVLVMACQPIDRIILNLQTVPVGVLIISASFLLFALGTVAALTRHRWLRDGKS